MMYRMKPLLIFIVVLVLCAGALIWNRERRIHAAMEQAKQQYEAGMRSVNGRHESVALYGGASAEALRIEEVETLARLKQERSERERRAQMIGYFFAPPEH